jgi:hypothetical protein
MGVDSPESMQPGMKTDEDTRDGRPLGENWNGRVFRMKLLHGWERGLRRHGHYKTWLSSGTGAGMGGRYFTREHETGRLCDCRCMEDVLAG